MLYLYTIIFCLLILNTISGCYPYLESLYSVVPVEGDTNWTQDDRNSFVFLCDDCKLNLDFWVVYESGDRIFLNKVEENPLLLIISIKNKQNSLPLSEDLHALSERSVSLSKNSELISLEDYREDITEEYHLKNYENPKYQKCDNKSYQYEYRLPEFDSKNNHYRLNFYCKLELYDATNDLNCKCSISPLNFQIIYEKEVWVFTPGHSGPLF